MGDRTLARAAAFQVTATFVIAFFLCFSPQAEAALYQPGATLDPSCLPTDPACGVATTTYSGGVAYNAGTVTNTGLLSITPQNGSALTGALTIATSTAGTGFSITGSGSTITFDLPTASASATGLLSSSDWSTFNNKQNALTFTYPIVDASNTVSLAFGTTTANAWSALQQFNGGASTTEFTSMGNTYLADGGGMVGIGTTSPAFKLDVAGIIGDNGNQAIDIPVQTQMATNSPLTYGDDNYDMYVGNGGQLSTTTTDTLNPIDQLPFEVNGSFNGTLNTFVGMAAGVSNVSGNQNTFLGSMAGEYTVNGTQNLFAGVEAGQSNTNGYHLTCLGTDACASSVTGSLDVSVGTDNMLEAPNMGNYNTSVGDGATLVLNGGTDDSVLGFSAAEYLTTGSENNAIGEMALQNDTTGSYNAADGTYALQDNTIGFDNTANGESALGSNINGANNTAVGQEALYANTTGVEATAIGSLAAYENTAATGTVAVGYEAGVGNFANYYDQGGTVIGFRSGYSLQTGSDYNTLLGYQAGYGITTGADNIMIGGMSTHADANVTTGSDNIGIGYNILFPSATASSQLNIGNFIYGTGLSGTGATVSPGDIGIGTTTPYSVLTLWGANTSGGTAAFTIANSASTTEFQVFDNGAATLAGTLTQNSDQRLKTNIQALDASSSLAAIEALNPVSFNWIDPTEGTGQQLGFIAQAVQQVFPQLVSTTSATALTPGGTLGLNYIGLISPMIGAIQALASEVDGFAQSITTAVLNATTVNTSILCVKTSNGSNVCITGDQLNALLNNIGESGALVTTPAVAPAPAPASDASSTDESETTAATSTDSEVTTDDTGDASAAATSTDTSTSPDTTGTPAATATPDATATTTS